MRSKDGTTRVVVDDRLGFIRLLAAGSPGRSFNQIEDLLREALADLWIREVFPDHLIAEDEKTSKIYQIPWAIVDDKVTLGDRVEVERTYVEVKAASQITKPVGESTSDDYGYQWDVQIVEAGVDKQGNAEYPLEVLQASAAVYNGARVFALSRAQHDDPKNPYGKSVRDLVGWLTDTKGNDRGIAGRLVLLKTAKWLRDALVEAFEKGNPDLLGLSHDIFAKAAKGRAGQPPKVEAIVKVDSVEVVYDPIAGGKFLRMAAARGGGDKTKEDENMLEKLLAALKANRPDAYKTIEAKVADKTVTEDEVIALLAAAPGPALPTDLDTRITAAVSAAIGAGKGQDGETAKLLEQLKLQACGGVLRDELRESGLPALSQERMKKRFEGKVFETTELQAAIKDEKEFVDKLTGAGSVSGAGQIRVGNEEPEKIQAALDRLFDVKVDDRFKDVVGFKSIRAAYGQITGDIEVSGRPTRDGLRFGESFMQYMQLPAAYASNSFSFLLGNTMYRRLVQDYRAVDYFEQILISFVRNAADFKTMESVRVGYYGDLPDVDPETANYAELVNFTDEEISYAINQKGGLVSVSRKTIINDDMRALTKIPNRIGRSARRTKAQRVWNKVITNATYKGDSKAVFHNDHDNLGAVALSADAAGIIALTNRLVAMFNQTEPDSGKKLCLGAEYLWVPREIFEIAKQLNSPWPGAEKPNPHAGRFGANHERIVVNKLTTDVSDWGLVANKADTELLEIAYLNGREEPEFFVADNPLVGQMFLADQLQYKVRHEYEVEIDDYRGLDKSVIAD